MKEDSVSLLQWTRETPGEQIKDPLGLSFRVGFRLADELLHCITALGKRARYYTFFPWAIEDYNLHERGTVKDNGIGKALRERDKALVLGSLLRHDVEACPGGGLGGTKEGKSFLQAHSEGTIDQNTFSHLRHNRTQLSIYKGCLINLGFFAKVAVPPTEETDEDDEERDDPRVDVTQLSERGRQLAQAYQQTVAQTEYVREQLTGTGPILHAVLTEFGQAGCLCGICSTTSSERVLLRDILFDFGASNRQTGHYSRRMTLLLVLEAARLCSVRGTSLDERAFRTGVYFNRIIPIETRILNVDWPKPLQDIAHRWRMYYFHFYLTSALESLLKGFLRIMEESIGGGSVSGILSRLEQPAVALRLSELLGIRFPGRFLALSPTECIALLPASPVLEEWLHGLLWNECSKHDAGLACGLLLLFVILERYRSEVEGTYHSWYQNHTPNPLQDVALPGVLDWLEVWDSQWRGKTLGQLLPAFCGWFLVQLHENVSYDRGFAAGSGLFLREGERLIALSSSFTPTARNARFSSTIQILLDLMLLEQEEESLQLSKEGEDLLSRLLREENRG